LQTRDKEWCALLNYEIITDNLSYKRDEWTSIVLPAVLHERINPDSYRDSL
jgi:hypothetical protein